jgi:hypothetical protein
VELKKSETFVYKSAIRAKRIEAITIMMLAKYVFIWGQTHLLMKFITGKTGFRTKHFSQN